VFLLITRGRTILDLLLKKRVEFFGRHSRYESVVGFLIALDCSGQSVKHNGARIFHITVKRDW
jgi:hypothetical protein